MKILPLLILLTAFIAGNAHADLRVCNDTGKPLGVSIGYKQDGSWTSEGWWRVPKESCSALIEGDLSSRFYYLHAEDAAGKDRWKGGVFMCTSPKKFKIDGLEDCFARGFERSGFFEVDTGEQKNWQVRLSDISPQKTDPSPATASPAAPAQTN